MKNLLLLVISILVLASCGSPLKKQYNEDTFGVDSKELLDVLDTADVYLILGTVMRKSFVKEPIAGLTYQDLLDDGKIWKAEQEKIKAEKKVIAEKAAAEQKVLAEKAKADEVERITRLNNAANVTVFKKGFYEGKYGQDQITVSFIIENKSDKNIRGVKGTIFFNDLFDDNISILNFKYDKVIKANTTAKWDAGIDYNQFMDDDVKLKNTQLKNIKLVWNPEVIIFTDGSKLL